MEKCEYNQPFENICQQTQSLIWFGLHSKPKQVSISLSLVLQSLVSVLIIFLSLFLLSLYLIQGTYRTIRFLRLEPITHWFNHCIVASYVPTSLPKTTFHLKLFRRTIKNLITYHFKISSNSFSHLPYGLIKGFYVVFVYFRGFTISKLMPIP